MSVCPRKENLIMEPYNDPHLVPNASLARIDEDSPTKHNKFGHLSPKTIVSALNL